MASKVMELIKLHGVQLGTDTTTYEAEAKAKQIIESIDLTVDHPIEIHIDRFDGMLILCDNMSEVRGFHFRTAICGYNGSGPRAAAAIMKLFGFDQFSFDEVLNMINHGADQASFSFDILMASPL